MPTALTAAPEPGRTLLMSGVYLVVCHSCTYSEGFKFGIGSEFSSLKSTACLIHPARLSQIQGILKINGFSDPEFGFRTFHCPICSNLCDDFWVRIKHENSIVYETEVRCKKCDGPMVSISQPEYIKALPCPDCYNTELEPVKVMPWD
jgi:hypothetical protein